MDDQANKMRTSVEKLYKLVFSNKEYFFTEDDFPETTHAMLVQLQSAHKQVLEIFKETAAAEARVAELEMQQQKPVIWRWAKESFLNALYRLHGRQEPSANPHATDQQPLVNDNMSAEARQEEG
jgi:hypothetical protein